MPEISVYDGPPTDPVFGSTKGNGTGVIIDSTSNEPYYIKPGTGPKKLGPGIDGFNTPIGGFYLSGTSENPATTLGYGVWALKAVGNWML